MSHPSEQETPQLEVLMRDALLGEATGESYAVCTPELQGKTRFDADFFWYWGDSHAPAAVMVKDRHEVNNELGAYFRLDFVQGQARVINAFASIGNGLTQASQFEIKDLDWRPGEQLSFGFEFSFIYNGETYQYSGGHLLLRF